MYSLKCIKFISLHLKIWVLFDLIYKVANPKWEITPKLKLITMKNLKLIKNDFIWYFHYCRFWICQYTKIFLRIKVFI